MKKRMLAILLCVSMMLSSTTVAFAAAETFQDVPADAWYYSDVDFVAERGYFKGTSATEFSPDLPMTRAMFVTVLARVDDAAVDSAAAPFDDVASGTWYSGEVAWAAANGIVNGVGDNRFAPDQAVTREQMAAIIARYVAYYAKEKNVTFKETVASQAFSDADQISDFAVDAVKLCQSYGLLSGGGDGSFNPAAVSTRSQVAAAIHKLDNFLRTGTAPKKPGGGVGVTTSESTETTVAGFVEAAQKQSNWVTANIAPENNITIHDDITISNNYATTLKLNLDTANTGNFTVNSTSAATIEIIGSGSVSSLTVNAPNATVKNAVDVNGSVTIQAVSHSTFKNTGAISGSIIVTGSGAIEDTQEAPVPVVIATDAEVAVRGHSTAINVTADGATVTVATVDASGVNESPTISSTADGVTVKVGTVQQVTLTGTVQTVEANTAAPSLKVDGTVAEVKAPSASSITLAGTGSIEKVESTKANAAIEVKDTAGQPTSLSIAKVETGSGATVTAPDNTIDTVAAGGSVALETSVATVKATAPNAEIKLSADKVVNTVEADNGVKISGGSVGQVDAAGGEVVVGQAANVGFVNDVSTGGTVTARKDDNTEIEVTRKAAKPERVTVAAATEAGKFDVISGVDDTMEYQKAGASDWAPVTGITVEPQATGDYYVRVKEHTEGTQDQLVTILASEPVTVTIAKAVGVSSAAVQGKALVGETLTAAANADATGTLKYQWKADGDDIAGATGKTFILTDACVNKTVTVAIQNYGAAWVESAGMTNITADKTGVDKLIEKADEVRIGVAEKDNGTTAAEVALGVVFVTKQDTKDLTDTVEAVKTATSGKNLTTDQVNTQLGNLSAAIDKYVGAKKIGTFDEVNKLKSELGTLITTAENQKKDVVTNDAAENVAPDKKWVLTKNNEDFTTAIAAAKAAQESRDAAVLSKGIVDLNAALNTYLKAIRKGAELDDSVLKAAIAAAEHNKGSVVVDTAPGKDALPSQSWVTQDDLTKYDAAITKAKAVSATKQSDNISAVTALNTATDTFNTAKKAGTKDVIAPVVTGVSAEKNEQTGKYTIKFTSNENGKYAYQLNDTAEGKWSPEAAVTKNEVTSFEYELKGSKDIIYIKVLDDSQNATIVSVTLEKVLAEPVATIGSVGYASLADAVAAAKNSDTVKLEKNSDIGKFITIDKTLTLDTNGKTITFTGDVDQREPLFKLTGGNLTVTGNGTIDSKTVGKASGKWSCPIFLVGEDSTLLVENGTYTTASFDIVKTGGKATINGGTFTCTAEDTSVFDGCVMISVLSKGNLTMKGGTVEAFATTDPSSGMYGVYAQDGGKIVLGDPTSKQGPTIKTLFAPVGFNNQNSPAELTVYGGAYTSTADPVNAQGGLNWWHKFCAGVYASCAGKFDIQGGIFAAYHGVNVPYKETNTDVEISGGEFNTKTALSVGTETGTAGSDAYTRKFSITGGTFSTDPSAFVPKATHAATQAEGKWIVKSLTAEQAEASIGGTYFSTLQAAMDAAKNGETVTLLKDVSSTTITIDKPGAVIDLDFNGHKLTMTPSNNSSSENRIYIYAGTINLVGVGTIDSTQQATVVLCGSQDENQTNQTTLKVGKDITITSLYYPIMIGSANGNDKSYGVNAIIDGTLKGGAYINGTVTAIHDNSPKITINSTARIEGGQYLGIYAAGYGHWKIVDGATITGGAGIELRAGTMTIGKATITGTKTPTHVEPNGNGSTTDGVGIAIAQHTTKAPIELTINGADVNGFTAFYQSNPQKNDADAIAKIKVSIIDGRFTAINGGTNSVYSENLTGFITGGTFSSDPSDYVAPTHIATEANNEWTVKPLTAEQATASIGGTYYNSLDAAVAAAQSNDTVKLLTNVTLNQAITIEADKNFTLDLNGKTYTYTPAESAKARAIIMDGGTLSVINSGEGGKLVATGSGTTSSDGAGAYGFFMVNSTATLNLNGVTVENARPWGLNVKVMGGTANLTNVTVNSRYGGGIEVTEADLGEHSQPGTATLTNCTFTQTGYFDHCSSAVSVSGGSSLTVNGGTYTSDGRALYVFSSGGYITVKDGTFTGAIEAFRAEIDTSTYPQYEGGLIIEGGNYTGQFTINSPASLTITGGKFSVDPSAYLKDGYVAVGDGGTWTVIAKPAPAMRAALMDTEEKAVPPVEEGLPTEETASPAAGEVSPEA